MSKYDDIVKAHLEVQKEKALEMTIKGRAKLEKAQTNMTVRSSVAVNMSTETNERLSDTITNPLVPNCVKYVAAGHTYGELRRQAFTILAREGRRITEDAIDREVAKIKAEALEQEKAARKAAKRARKATKKAQRQLQQQQAQPAATPAPTSTI